jgi:NADPH:quinone reductase-like Zn-dependent oxidoreductase
MRRLIGTSRGVRVARAPWPVPESGRILVRVEASLVSLGTELAPYRAAAVQDAKGPTHRLVAKAATAIRYARLAARHPDKAVAKLGRIAKGVLTRVEAGTGPSDLGDQGWTLGYSAAGTVVAVGQGVTGFAPGDRVSCAGAGIANHADAVSVPMNLACKAPELSARQAAFATVGAIALQGVRRARPELGECVAVIGLGLLGVLSIQMLVAAGCRVIGFDPEARRI